MDHRVFERKLAWHCAPALMGLKASCLMSLSNTDCPQLEVLAEWYNAKLQGPRFLVLGRCRERSLLLVYRPELLKRALADPLAEQMLAEAGYPTGAPLSWQLRRLMDRLEGDGEFPHEVGLFLGYPPQDVAGFLNDPDGTGCKLCGFWKVYHDVEEARRQFQKFRRCRDWMRGRLERGETLTALLGRQIA